MYRNFRVIETANGQILGGGINTPHSLKNSQLSDFLSPTILESSNHQDLPILPPKFIDLWRIGGEGPDLHPHRGDLYFLPIYLGISWLGFPVGKPSSPLLYSWCYLDLLWSSWEPPIQLWVCASSVCKGFDLRPKRGSIVEGKLATFVVEFIGEEGEPLWRCG